MPGHAQPIRFLYVKLKAARAILKCESGRLANEQGVGAIMVVIAADITPAEIVMHLPAICQEKKIPYLFVNTRAELGKAAKISIPCSALAVLDFGDKGLEADFKAISKDVAALRK